jgi:hypothetical protein
METTGEESPSWRERIAALRYVPPLIRLIWETHRGYTVAMVLLRLLRAFVPIATLWIGKLIIDAVVEARSGPFDISRLWKLVAIEIAVVVVGEILARASSLVCSMRRRSTCSTLKIPSSTTSSNERGVRPSDVSHFLRSSSRQDRIS